MIEVEPDLVAAREVLDRLYRLPVRVEDSDHFATPIAFLLVLHLDDDVDVKVLELEADDV